MPPPSDPPTTARRRRWAWWAVQGSLAALVAWFVVRVVRRDLDSLGALEMRFDLHWPSLLLAAVVVLLTYGLLIDAWRSVLRGWGASIRFPTAIRIWTVSNLGRYLPGKVWSVAGLAVLAQREGVPPWAAGGSAVVMQVIAVATGAAVAVGFLPRTQTGWAIGVTLLVAVSALAVLSAPATYRRLNRLARGRFEVTPLRGAAVARAGIAMVAAWLAYGAAFWLVARGTMGEPPTWRLATGTFAAGYIVGLLAVFAPGGVVVREGVFVGTLAGVMGTGAALAVSIASRLLLTATEITAALFGLSMRSTRSPGDAA